MFLFRIIEDIVEELVITLKNTCLSYLLSNFLKSKIDFTEIPLDKNHLSIKNITEKTTMLRLLYFNNLLSGKSSFKPNSYIRLNISKPLNAFSKFSEEPSLL